MIKRFTEAGLQKTTRSEIYKNFDLDVSDLDPKDLQYWDKVTEIKTSVESTVIVGSGSDGYHAILVIYKDSANDYSSATFEGIFRTKETAESNAQRVINLVESAEDPSTLMTKSRLGNLKKVSNE